MDDIKLAETCTVCCKPLWLRESCRGDDSTSASYLVKYCKGGCFPAKEIAKLSEVQNIET